MAVCMHVYVNSKKHDCRYISMNIVVSHLPLSHHQRFFSVVVDDIIMQDATCMESSNLKAVMFSLSDLSPDNTV